MHYSCFRPRPEPGHARPGALSERSPSTAAAVGPRDDLQEVAVGVVPVDAPPSVVVVDATCLLVRRVRPVRQPARVNAPEDPIELFFADEEGVVLDGEVLVGDDVGQGHMVVELDIPERPEPYRRRAAEHLGEEGCRHQWVAGMNDGVVQFDGHRLSPEGGGASCNP